MRMKVNTKCLQSSVLIIITLINLCCWRSTTKRAQKRVRFRTDIKVKKREEAVFIFLFFNKYEYLLHRNEGR